MKKLAVISLICIYALATMGFSLKQFYCCGKLSSVSVGIISSESKKCNTENKNDDRCCKNKFRYFKVKDNHVTSSDINIPLKHFTHVDFFTPSLHNIIFESRQAGDVYRSNAPPLYFGIPVYISNCVFRI